MLESLDRRGMGGRRFNRVPLDIVPSRNHVSHLADICRKYDPEGKKSHELAGKYRK